MARFSDFPILTREVRARFRRERAFALLGVLLMAAVWMVLRRLGASDVPIAPGVSVLVPLSQELLVQLVWTQIAGVCLLAPMIAAPLIARERESGATDDLLLTPLSPLRLALEKWAAGGLFLGLLLLALWPLDMVALLLGDTPIADMWPLALLVAGCWAWGSALGTVCSAGARRAASALRSAVGIAFVWLAGSLLCAVLTGETTWGAGVERSAGLGGVDRAHQPDFVRARFAASLAPAAREVAVLRGVLGGRNGAVCGRGRVVAMQAVAGFAHHRSQAQRQNWRGERRAVAVGDAARGALRAE